MTNTAAPPGGDRRTTAPGSHWVLAGLVLAIGVVLITGALGFPLPLNVGYLGPQWFPIGVGIALVLLGASLAVQALRGPRPGSAEAAPEQGSDWRAFGLVVATLTGHVVVLVLVGWIPAGVVLFWGVARAVGSVRPLFDLGVAVVFSCAVQFAFAAGLGVALPVGLLLEVR